METITKYDVAELAQMQEAISLSIFLPTHQVGEATLKLKDALVLKNMLKSVKERLQHLGINKGDTDRFTGPVEDLVGDKSFWRQQSHSLALFIRDGFFKAYALPTEVAPFHHISHHFLLLPLFPLFSGDGKFWLLALTLHHVRLYEVSQFNISRVITEEFVPSRPEEVVGFDYQQKSLQFRNQGSGHSQTIFHGQGEGKEDRKEEILKFFRAVNKALVNKLNEENMPLVVATMDHLFPIYQEANSYTHLKQEPIICNPADMERKTLHELAWKAMQSTFDLDREKKLALFRQFNGTERTDTDLHRIFPNAKLGLVDTLFVQEDGGLKGKENASGNTTNPYESDEVSSINQTAIAVFFQGGEVYLLPKERMPAPISPVNVLYRY